MTRLLLPLLVLVSCATVPRVDTSTWAPPGSGPAKALLAAFPQGLVLDTAGRERAKNLLKEARVRFTLHHDNERRWEAATGTSVLVWDLDDERKSVNDVRFRRVEWAGGDAAPYAAAERESGRLWAELERHLMEVVTTDE